MKLHNIKRRSAMGFTLLELMVVVLILGILASIAYPLYLDSVYKGRRSDGQKALLNVVNREEQYFLDHKAYASTATALGLSSLASEDGYYNITIVINNASCGGAPCFLLTASATGAQGDDTKCSTLTLSSDGTKDFTGTGSLSECW